MILKDALDALHIAFANFEQAARSDDKTPLQNALALGESKETFAATKDSPHVVVFADINRFKAINTEYGYAAGDAAINQVGILIQEFFVANCQAQAFRQSGDEFVILLQSKFLDRFRAAAKSFTSCQVLFDEKSFSVGVSFGYAVSDETLGFEMIKARAEIACKKAKIEGSGSCFEWTEEIEQTAFESLRDNCPNCGTINTCDVPREMIIKMDLKKLRSCAVCGTSLS